MLYKATISFGGKVSMTKDEVRELSDQFLIDDLINAGYIVPIETPKKETKKRTPKK